MITRKGNYKFDKYKKNLQIEKRQGMPLLVGNAAKNHFLKGFSVGDQQGGGFTNNSRGGWEKRKKITRRQRGKNLLVDSGDLRRFIQAKGILKRTFERTEIGVKGIRYARIHNEGGRIRGGSMPKREYIGDSDVLTRKLKVLLTRFLDKKVFK